MTRKDRIVSVRMERGLFDALREHAHAEGRSVSGEIVYLVRDQVQSTPPSRKPLPITGWLSRMDVLDTFQEFRSARREASSELTAAIRRKARRK